MMRWLRRRLPLLLLLAAITWIVTIVVWITLDPQPGPGNPVR